MIGMIYLYNVLESKVIYVHDNKRDSNQTELLSNLKKFFEENYTEEILTLNSNKELNLKANKLYTNHGNYYFSLKNNLYVGVFTLQRKNEEFYKDFSNEISNDENFLLFSDDKEKLKAILETYISKYFPTENQALENNLLMNKNNNDINLGSAELNIRKMDEINPSLYVADSIEAENEGNIKIPKNHRRNQSLKVILIITFVAIGIGLAIIVPFVIR